MSVLGELGRQATYRGRRSWFDEHPLPRDWRPSLGGARPTPPPAAPPPAGEEWQWVVVDDRGRVVAGDTMRFDVDDPQEAAYEAMREFMAGRGMPAHEAAGLLCAARLVADPAVMGVVDGRDW